jgi:hypothetical protein
MVLYGGGRRCIQKWLPAGSPAPFDFKDLLQQEIGEVRGVIIGEF